ncbi:hypothetical protein PSPO01_06221 [Paraphaeosphaeria sporulosa]
MPDAGCNPTLSFPMLWSFVLLGLAVADLILSGLPGAGRPIPCVQTFFLSAVEHCSGNALFVRLRTSLKVLHSLSTFLCHVTPVLVRSWSTYHRALLVAPRAFGPAHWPQRVENRDG